MPRDEELMMMDPCAEFDALIFFYFATKGFSFATRKNNLDTPGYSS